MSDEQAADDTNQAALNDNEEIIFGQKYESAEMKMQRPGQIKGIYESPSVTR